MTQEERLKVLEMVQAGELTPEEAMRLLTALGNEPASEPEADASPHASRKPRWLHIRVTDTDKNQQRVNLVLPVALAKFGLKMGARFGPEIEGLDWTNFEGLFNGEIIGSLVDVVDDEDGEHVEIFLD